MGLNPIKGDIADCSRRLLSFSNYTFIMLCSGIVVDIMILIMRNRDFSHIIDNDF